MTELRDANVLVTGGAGFLGSHLVARLRAAGVERIVVPRSDRCDLRDARAAERLFREVRPDMVFHLAGRVGGILANRRHPGTFFRDNMLMGVHVLEGARSVGSTKVILVGTVCAYPKLTAVPFREDDLWNGYPEETNAAYGVAKRALFTMAQAYRQEFGCNFIGVLPVNLYGPRDDFRPETSHVVPGLIRKLDEARAQGSTTTALWGSGEVTREFLYVEDCAGALVQAAERYDGDEPVNIGSGHEISIRDLAARIAAAVGYQGAVTWDPSYPDGQPRRRLDTSRARERFGFVARTPLDDGLARTIAWWRTRGAA